MEFKLYSNLGTKLKMRNQNQIELDLFTRFDYILILFILFDVQLMFLFPILYFVRFIFHFSFMLVLFYVLLSFLIRILFLFIINSKMFTQETQLNTPFVRKLNHILTDHNYSHIITWDPSGTMIDILDENKIQTEILPKFFRHSKFESFIRQLNLYGFKKIKKTDAHRFRHPDLIRGNSLFSIKSQRKFKSVLQKSKSVLQKSKSLQEEASYKSQKCQEQNSAKNKDLKTERSGCLQAQKVQTRNLGDWNSMGLFLNSANSGQILQNSLNLTQISQFEHYFYPNVHRNWPSFGLQSPCLQNFNNIFFYN